MGWQRDLAVASDRVGECCRRRANCRKRRRPIGEPGDLPAVGETGSEQCGLATELAATHGCVGEVLQAQDKLPEATAAYRRA